MNQLKYVFVGMHGVEGHYLRRANHFEIFIFSAWDVVIYYDLCALHLTSN